MGVDLTRERLRAALDSATFDEGLTPALRWTPQERSANIWSRPYKVTTAGGSATFSVVGDFVADPWPGADV